MGRGGLLEGRGMLFLVAKCSQLGVDSKRGWCVMVGVLLELS